MKSLFVLQTENGEFIGIDKKSGGYPYEASLLWCHKFTSKESALKYNALDYKCEVRELKLVDNSKSIQPKDFKVDNWSTVGMGAGKFEYEQHLAWQLKLRKELDMTFEEPLECKYNHDDMVEEGFLENHGNKRYSLTKKSVGLLYSHFQ